MTGDQETTQSDRVSADRFRYVKTTHDVSVRIRALFLESQSFPEMRHFVWSYHVEIENHRADPVRLRRRFWRITDNQGGVQEVEGEGVVGEQPLIQAGSAYSYGSGVPLTTPSGLMGGRYELETEAGERFWVDTPTFSLDSPHEARVLN